MEFIKGIIDFILHIDRHLDTITTEYGTLTYVILFIIIFAETGLVVTPFLPGDSLLFAIGAIAARGTLDVFVLFFILVIAAILGDTVNYWVGKFLEHKLEDLKFINKHKTFTISMAAKQSSLGGLYRLSALSHLLLPELEL